MRPSLVQVRDARGVELEISHANKVLAKMTTSNAGKKFTQTEPFDGAQT